jgi:hypothetical protein
MQQIHQPLVQIIIRYDAPLQRYARRFVKDQKIAEAIVKDMFEKVYDVNSFNTDADTLREIFVAKTFQLVCQWLSANSLPLPKTCIDVDLLP